MNKNNQEYQFFLEKQLEWCKSQDRILEEIENKLYEMKEIAMYARDHEVMPMVLNRLNNQLNTLKQDILFLEKQLQSIVN
ncbi:hypothetical protein [Ureibacillus endophyticus]|uniref:Uncharacterized protein n=1 Tax=Ureibacillus endophyticus TaxID=1978490 RepID=A0A494YRV6_9BACL|nr:hypothetical protein [Lysinibacillus endophyticus]RKQ12325.1 hypothetical protein D8M03_17040 [Lysinibacillus endophyticus]